MAANPPLMRISGYSMKKAMTERSSMIWNTLSSRVASRPATTRISIRASQPAIHNAALGLEGVRYIEGIARACRARGEQVGESGRYRRPLPDLQRANLPMQCCTASNSDMGAAARSVLRDLACHSGARVKRTNLESWDSPMCNCTSEVSSYGPFRNDGPQIWRTE